MGFCGVHAPRRSAASGPAAAAGLEARPHAAAVPRRARCSLRPARRTRGVDVGITVERAPVTLQLDGEERVLAPGRTSCGAQRTSLAGGRRMTLLIAVKDASRRPRTGRVGPRAGGGRPLGGARRPRARARRSRRPASAAFGDSSSPAIDGAPVEALTRLVDGAARRRLRVRPELLVRSRCGAGHGPRRRGAAHGHVAPLLLVRPGMRAVSDPQAPATCRSRAARPPRRRCGPRTTLLCARGREIVMLHVVTGDTPAEIGSLPAPRMTDQEHYEWSAWQDEFTMRFSTVPRGRPPPRGRARRRARRHHRRGGGKNGAGAHRAVVGRELERATAHRDQGAPGHGALPAAARAQRAPTPIDLATHRAAAGSERRAVGYARRRRALLGLRVGSTTRSPASSRTRATSTAPMMTLPMPPTAAA